RSKLGHLRAFLMWQAGIFCQKHRRKADCQQPLVIWNTKNYNPHQICQMFVASKIQLKKIKETLSNIRCKNSALWALFLLIYV
ncbi:hypothetical protein, partial [Neisseria bacilliformis]